MFQKKTWKDRVVEFAGRRRITNIETNEEEVVDVTRAEGSISQEGDAFSAANMNDLEERISEGLKITKATLAAGATSITINDSRITTDSVLSFFTGVFGISPTAVSVGTGFVTLTFKAQTANMEVGVRVDG